jgi:hypothetical protein
MSQMSTSVHTVEDGISWVNATGLETGTLQTTVDHVAREVANWVSTTQGRGRSSLFDRQAYVAPDTPYRMMRVAKKAVENDDVVGGVCDVTEGLIFQGIKWEDEDSDTADVFNQINRDLDIDSFARQWHREDFKYSQVVVGVWWGRKEYTVRGRTRVEDKGAEPVADPTNPAGQKPKMKQGPRRRKKFDIVCPVALTFLDPLKVVPLSPGPFGQDRLAWHATEHEYASYSAALDGQYADALMTEFFNGKTTGLSMDEEATLVTWGIDPKRLINLNPANVFRYCRTKMSYERFPDNRLKSVFPLLDLKQQLLEADRVNLVGAANYILLVKKGDKDDPADQEELDNLKENFTVVAKLPVIVGDHRLNIEIITPDQTYVLDSDKYDTLDRRILSRTMGALTIASSGQRNESTLTVARGVARLLETRRHMMKRALENQIARAVVDMPANEGKFETEPNLTFTPRNVQLDADSTVVQQIMALRTQKELSRETVLEYFGFDQATEAQRREFEEESGLDDIFGTQIPFSATGPDGKPIAPQTTGAAGGRPTGGGKSKQSPQAQTKPKTPRGNPRTGRKT